MTLDTTGLESSRLRFEPLRVEHASLLFEVLRDPRVSQFLNCAPPTSVDDLAEDFARRRRGPGPRSANARWLNFAVQRKVDGQWIGRIEAAVTGDWGEVGFLLGAPVWGQGYGSESLTWLHEYLRSVEGVREFWATVAPSNERSIRLLNRCGYLPAEQRENPLLSSYDLGDLVFRRFVETDLAQLPHSE